MCWNRFFVLIVCSALAAHDACAARDANKEKSQTRCGWFVNPTPGNAWLLDRDGEWTIGVQGGLQADGDWPAFKDSQWVTTMASYGHGCACMNVHADPVSRQISRIDSARAQNLEVCRRDRALKEPS